MSQRDLNADRHRLMEAIAAVLAAGASHSDEAYVRLFASHPIAMGVYDVDTQQILDANDAALLQFGYSHSEFICLSLTDIMPGEDVDKFLELTRQLPQFDQTGPWRSRMRDGTVVQVLITSHAIRFGPNNARLVIVEDPDQALL